MTSTVWAIVVAAIGSGFVWWAFDKASDANRARRRRAALKLVFTEGRVPPFYVEEAVWSNGHHATRQLFCVGVSNSFDEPLTARVVVEEVSHQTPPLRPERPLQVFAAPDGQAEATVHPGDAPALFQFAESFDSTDMAFLCYATPSHEGYPGRDTRILLRVEGGGGTHRAAFRVRTHALHGVKIPFTVERD